MRLFIALDLSGNKNELYHCSKIKTTWRVKWVNPEGMHLTLKF